MVFHRKRLLGVVSISRLKALVLHTYEIFCGQSNHFNDDESFTYSTSDFKIGELNLHVAEIGSGPAVLLLHGFPEIWYSWRHQMIALAEAGFHAIAPDFRGYGLSDQPSEPEKAAYYDLVEDTVGLLDALGIDKAFIVAKDFGAFIAYYIGLCHPDRVKGIVTLGIPYRKPGAFPNRDSAPKGLYVRHWQEPGRGLADLGRFDVKTVIRNIYTLFSSSELPVTEDGKEVMDLYDPSILLPPWFTEDDLQTYSSLYEKNLGLFTLCKSHTFAAEGIQGD